MPCYCPKCGQPLYETSTGYRCSGCRQLWALTLECPMILLEVSLCSVCHDEHLVLVPGQCGKG